MGGLQWGKERCSGAAWWNREYATSPSRTVSKGGRDHWANAFSLCMADGGVPGGQVWGETDENGAYVKDKPVEVHDFTATIFDKLGIDYRNPLGRPPN